MRRASSEASHGELRTRASKFLSLLLRHRPEVVGLTLDAQGWAEIDDIVRRTAGRRLPLTRPMIEEIAATSDKQRFVISEDGRRIRANQGHSISVDLELEPTAPPTVLYHGTAERNLDSIMRQGLLRGARQHVHLTADRETALQVGRRHGRPAVLRVAAAEMHARGIVFFRSANGVWLTEHVPVGDLCVGPLP